MRDTRRYPYVEIKRIAVRGDNRERPLGEIMGIGS